VLGWRADGIKPERIDWLWNGWLAAGKLRIQRRQSQNGTIIPPMRIIAIGTLRDYWIKRPDAERALRAWISEVRAARWTSPTDVKAQFGNASVLAGRRVVFNIKGNDHRLVVAVAYVLGAVYVKFVGTHAEYDAIDAQTVKHKPKTKRTKP
jgi:mRNA interferase HigB